MTDQGRKLTISFSNEHREVRELLQEHFTNSGEKNLSSVIIALIRSALGSSASKGESSSGLYELDRISEQLDELNREVGNLAEQLTRLPQEAGSEELSEIRKQLSRLQSLSSHQSTKSKPVRGILETGFQNFRYETEAWYERFASDLRSLVDESRGEEVDAVVGAISALKGSVECLLPVREELGKLLEDDKSRGEELNAVVEVMSVLKDAVKGLLPLRREVGELRENQVAAENARGDNETERIVMLAMEAIRSEQAKTMASLEEVVERSILSSDKRAAETAEAVREVAEAVERTFVEDDDGEYDDEEYDDGEEGDGEEDDREYWPCSDSRSDRPRERESYCDLYDNPADLWKGKWDGSSSRRDRDSWQALSIDWWAGDRWRSRIVHPKRSIKPVQVFPNLEGLRFTQEEIRGIRSTGGIRLDFEEAFTSTKELQRILNGSRRLMLMTDVRRCLGALESNKRMECCWSFGRNQIDQRSVWTIVVPEVDVKQLMRAAKHERLQDGPVMLSVKLKASEGDLTWLIDGGKGSLCGDGGLHVIFRDLKADFARLHFDPRETPKVPQPPSWPKPNLLVYHPAGKVRLRAPGWSTRILHHLRKRHSVPWLLRPRPEDRDSWHGVALDWWDGAQWREKPDDTVKEWSWHGWQKDPERRGNATLVPAVEWEGWGVLKSISAAARSWTDTPGPYTSLKRRWEKVKKERGGNADPLDQRLCMAFTATGISPIEMRHAWESSKVLGTETLVTTSWNGGKDTDVKRLACGWYFGLNLKKKHRWQDWTIRLTDHDAKEMMRGAVVSGETGEVQLSVSFEVCLWTLLEIACNLSLDRPLAGAEVRKAVVGQTIAEFHNRQFSTLYHRGDEPPAGILRFVRKTKFDMYAPGSIKSIRERLA